MLVALADDLVEVDRLVADERPQAEAPRASPVFPLATRRASRVPCASPMDEARLIERLRAIEALHAGAATPGERTAAALGRERLLARLRSLEQADPPREFQFSMTDPWSRQVFCALLRRYGIKPYRYSRQRRTTVMARVPERFVDETLWPEYLEIDRELQAYLAEATARVLRQVLESDSTEAEVRPDSPQLGAGGTPTRQS